MIRGFIHTLKRRFEHKALVLMYHRVAELETDVWRLAVSPTHFAQQLQVLSNNWQVVPLSEMAEDLQRNRVKKNSIAITFDDGYADNYLAAKPLLEKYRLPATFFVSSGNIGQQTEYWWDELEHILLSTENLPQHFVMQLGDTHVAFDLGPECELTGQLHEKHRRWKAYVQEPPTLRCDLFLKVWQALRPLPHHAQQTQLQHIRTWAGMSLSKDRPLYHCMSLEQLQDLGRSDLLHIGAHTVTHPDLAGFSASAQQQEILENKAFLESASGKKINLFAYPYGRYNNDTVAIAAKAGILAAVTTNGNLVKATSERLLLGRYLVDNWSGKELDKYLKIWLK